MEIQEATTDDSRAIAELHVDVWQRAYRDILPENYLASLSTSEREATWRRMVEQQPAHLLVARVADAVIGFVAFGASRDEDAPTDRAEIWAIYVEPASWSTGAGQALWLRAQQRIVAEGYKSASLWVLADNERAVHFYEQAGFVLEPKSRKSFELGGTSVEEVRYVRNVG